MAFRKGDVVEITGEVEYDESVGDTFVFIKIGHQRVNVAADDLVLRHLGFEIGDEAVYEPTNGNPLTCKVVAIHKEQAWVEGEYDGIVDMYELTRPEPEVVDVAPEATDLVETPPSPALVLTDEMPF